MLIFSPTCIFDQLEEERDTLKKNFQCSTDTSLETLKQANFSVSYGVVEEFCKSLEECDGVFQTGYNYMKQIVVEEITQIQTRISTTKNIKAPQWSIAAPTRGLPRKVLDAPLKRFPAQGADLEYYSQVNISDQLEFKSTKLSKNKLAKHKRRLEVQLKRGVITQTRKNNERPKTYSIEKLVQWTQQDGGHTVKLRWSDVSEDDVFTFPNLMEGQQFYDCISCMARKALDGLIIHEDVQIWVGTW